MKSREEKFSDSIGYRFNDPLLLNQALTHRSAGSHNNERLEFLGDAILGFVIADLLHGRFQEAAEGRLSRARSSLVKGETLAQLARNHELGDCLTLGSGELKSGGHRRDSILAGSLEAVIGAVYLDSDMDTAATLIRRLYEDLLVSLDINAVGKDPKTCLQEYLQGRRQPLPHYEVLAITGKEHNQTFVVQCTVEGLDTSFKGSGPSRRRAEQDAASKALAGINEAGVAEKDS